ncbi:hypothetical protein C5Y97_14210 [Blastopirellula marina]|uniref:Uncharacterized protein n=1 Tax=Blastopirellula marina TaxID=124 RepID=A0A2S8GGS2_9BACT|nr:hypothetical protein C5Y98_14200 [Blastopirellula marina]PQO43471.1 hypothetical protein C5Y93_22720 [Blastopirellula marina]PTL43851.1 hypothetical protein C5Y97_14210 [Blastopirellula marina]
MLIAKYAYLFLVNQVVQQDPQDLPVIVGKIRLWRRFDLIESPNNGGSDHLDFIGTQLHASSPSGR